MKWFKHDSNASIDAKLKRVRLKYGMEGYGLYWYCLELIAQTVEIHNLSFELEHDAELISMDTGIHQERVQEMMTDLVKWGLFENNQGVVTCLKMASRTDEYTSKILRTTSGRTPDKIPPNRIEENRVDKKRIEKQYPSGLNQQAWADYIEYRKQSKAKKLTDKGEAMKWTWLIDQGNEDHQQDIVNQTISNGWTGLFALKETPHGTHQQDNSAPARVQRAIDKANERKDGILDLN